ncbi:hypothetical protein DM47_5122 [Burkholderia mallei]|nr:hypothetical protein DM47_5122 [Burkholderia mallei]
MRGFLLSGAPGADGHAADQVPPVDVFAAVRRSPPPLSSQLRTRDASAKREYLPNESSSTITIGRP